jgi:hypothetical protein
MDVMAVVRPKTKTVTKVLAEGMVRTVLDEEDGPVIWPCT